MENEVMLEIRVVELEKYWNLNLN